MDTAVKSICSRPDCLGALVFDIDGEAIPCSSCRGKIVRVFYIMSGFNPLVVMSEVELMYYYFTGKFPEKLYI